MSVVWIIKAPHTGQEKVKWAFKCAHNGWVWITLKTAAVRFRTKKEADAVLRSHYAASKGAEVVRV